jgi:hypothetical protein
MKPIFSRKPEKGLNSKKKEKVSRDLFTKTLSHCLLCLPWTFSKKKLSKALFCFTTFIAIPAAKIRFGIIAAEFNKLFFYSLLFIVVRSAYEKGFSLVILYSASRTTMNER